MSFTYDVKQDRAQRPVTKAALQKAQSYGLFLFSKEFSKNGVCIQTENEFAVQVATDYLMKNGIRPDFVQMPSKIDPHTSVFRLELSADDSEKLIHSFGCTDAFSFNERLVSNEKTLSFFLGGVFLACGSVTDPGKSYHLEFAPSTEEMCDLLEALVGSVADCKRTTRKGSAVLYLKESEQIEDLLTFLGATHASLAVMEAKIVKDIRNHANRQTNCETANIDKTVQASAQQCADIRLLVDRLGWDGIPDNLRALAQLRLDNPSDSLRELGERLMPPLSRSGVCHRFARIEQMAAQLREK